MTGAQVRGGLFIVSAPSGGGKTSLTRALVPYLAERGVPAMISISHTTRGARPGEQHGVHYHFVGEPEFEGMVQRGDFLEHAHVFGRRYGTSRHAIEQMLANGTEVILDIDWQGGRQVRGRVPDAAAVFILPPSIEELDRRLRGRGQDGEDVIARRMAAARAELSHAPEYEWWIVNRDFDTALRELASLVLALRARRGGRAEPEAAAVIARLARAAQLRQEPGLLEGLLAGKGPVQ